MLNNKITSPIERDSRGVPQVLDEDINGLKAIPIVMVTKNADGSFEYDSGSGAQEVTVTNPPKTVAVGNVLSGTVDPNNADDYPKLIAPDGATAIEIQCPQSNTVPLLVSNMSMDFGDWEVYPGTSKVFYYSSLYVRLPEGTTEAQKVTFMAVVQG